MSVLVPLEDLLAYFSYITGTIVQLKEITSPVLFSMRFEDDQNQSGWQLGTKRSVHLHVEHKLFSVLLL